MNACLGFEPRAGRGLDKDLMDYVQHGAAGHEKWERASTGPPSQTAWGSKPWWDDVLEPWTWLLVP